MFHKLILHKILSILRPIALGIIYLSCYINLPILTSFILIIYSKKLTNIKYNLKSRKKIIYFYKSIGYDDLISTFNASPSNHEIFSLERSFLVKVFVFFVGNKVEDFNYLIKGTGKQKFKYKIFVKNVFLYMKLYWRLGGFITSTVNPKADHGMADASKELNLPFIVLHKEGIKTEKGRLVQQWIFKNRVGRFKGTKLIVYNKRERKAFLESGFVKKSEITVTGCPRFDWFLKLKKTHPNKKNIVFFLIQSGNSSYGMPYFNGKWFVPKILKKKIQVEKSNWDNVNFEYIKFIKKFIQTNKAYNIIIKTKVGFSSEQLKYLNNFNKKNIKIVKGGSSFSLIKNSEIIVAFNSTVVLEALAANRLLVSPIDLVHSKKLHNFILKIKKNYLPIADLDKLHNKNIKIKDLKKNNKNELNEIFNRYLGNSDGKASFRVAKCINDHFKKY
tara:strand:- start:722 stop:2056 length:1335 start_codon:yes stop_codon:yes gene_type:complete